ncbi:MAG: aldehyde dehydrogenase family protein [Pseudomonadales bacterium]
MTTNTNQAPALDVVSPFDGTLIETIPQSTAEDAERMLETASALNKNRDGWLAHHERTAILKKLAERVEAEAESFAMLIAKEGGKPLMDARVEVARAVDGIQLAIKELSHIMRGEEIPMGHTKAADGRIAFSTYEPIGVVLAVSAFNHPLNLIVHQVVPAIAVGCPVIVKPASSTPLNCLRFVELVHQSGLPEAWCQVCVCNSAVAEKLVTDARINFFSFIGSAKVGWTLRSKLAPGVRCALEHGGVAPVIVDEQADLEKAIPSLLKGGFYHAGQVCVSVQRVYAHQSIARELAQRLAAAADKLVVGDATREDTEVGPLIKPGEVDRVEQWVEEAVAQGAELVTGGKRLGDTTYAPTVLFNPPNDAKVSTVEVFGPVVCVYSYRDRQQAIELANGLDVAFQAAVFTRDINTAMDTVKRLDATAVMVNDHTAFRVDWMPFAGRRASGYGIGGIGYTMHDMVQIKMAVIKTD